MPSEFAEECASIDAARDAAFAALHEHNQRAAADPNFVGGYRPILDAFDDVTRRVAELKRKYFPRAGHFAVVNGAAIVASPKGRRTEVVWERAERRRAS